MRTRRHEAPRAPWGSFPLSELLVLLAGALVVVAALSWGTRRSAWAFIAAFTLASLAGLEVSIREHLAGHKSHTALLAGCVGVGTTTGAELARVHPVIALALGVAAFAATAGALRRAYGVARRGSRTSARRSSSATRGPGRGGPRLRRSGVSSYRTQAGSPVDKLRSSSVRLPRKSEVRARWRRPSSPMSRTGSPRPSQRLLARRLRGRRHLRGWTVGMDPSGEIVEGFEAQARRAFENMKVVFAAAAPTSRTSSRSMFCSAVP